MLLIGYSLKSEYNCLLQTAQR